MFVSSPGFDLGVSDAGFLFHVTTGTTGLNYNHMVQWTGTHWQVAPGERLGGYFGEYAKTPTDLGWHLADGSAIKYLDISAGALVEVNFTLPNLSNNPAYLKQVSTYTGAINPAVAPSVSNPANTGTDSGAGTTFNQGTGAALTVAAHTHTHPIGAPSVSLPGDPVPNMVVLPYFRM